MESSEFKKLELKIRGEAPDFREDLIASVMAYCGDHKLGVIVFSPEGSHHKATIECLRGLFDDIEEAVGMTLLKVHIEQMLKGGKHEN